MRIWITKYALSKGILEAEAERWNEVSAWFEVTEGGYREGDRYILGRDCFLTYVEARAAAEKIRENKIRLLRKQVARLSKLSFPPEREATQADLRLSVDDLPLPSRARNALRYWLQVERVGDLVVKTEAQMLKCRNFGHESLKAIKDALRPMGLRLGMRPADLEKLPLTAAS